MNKNIVLIVVTGVVVVGLSFYGGLLYGQSKNSLANIQNLSAGERQQLLQQLRGGAAGSNQAVNRRGGGQAGGGFVSGEIISKDDKSITVKLTDGGSKIVFFSDSAAISKSVSGTAGDLEVGKQVTVVGQASSDGSVTAQSIQIRSNSPALNGSQPR